MIKTLKYVVFEDNDGGYEHILLASPKMATEHKDMSINGARPVAAGFIDLTGESPVCHGSSRSLGLSSRGKEDEILFKMYFYGKEPICV